MGGRAGGWGVGWAGGRGVGEGGREVGGDQCGAATPSRQRHPRRRHARQDFYSLTLDSLKESKNERLWFKTNMKLANLWVRCGRR